MTRWLVIAVALLGGCALLKGATFEKSKVPMGMSMIYVYANDELGTGQAAYVDKTPETPDADDKIILLENTYYPYLVPAGPVRVFTDAASGQPRCVAFLAQEKASYYVRVRQRGDENRVELLDAEMASPEIGKTNKLNKEAVGDSDATFPLDDCLPL